MFWLFGPYGCFHNSFFFFFFFEFFFLIAPFRDHCLLLPLMSPRSLLGFTDIKTAQYFYMYHPMKTKNLNFNAQLKYMLLVPLVIFMNPGILI